MSAEAVVKATEPSRKRKGAEKQPPATPKIVNKNALSARSGEPQGDAARRRVSNITSGQVGSVLRGWVR